VFYHFTAGCLKSDLCLTWSINKTST